jgi:hypothetical protein
VDAFTSSGLLAVITLAFLEIVLGVFRSESYIVKAQETGQPPTGHYQSRDWVQVALATGAQGYVYKPDARRDLLPSIEAVLRGKQFVSSTIRSQKFNDIRAAKTPHRHELLFFSDETILLDSFTRFIAAALNRPREATPSNEAAGPPTDHS